VDEVFPAKKNWGYSLKSGTFLEAPKLSPVKPGEFNPTLQVVKTLGNISPSSPANNLPGEYKIIMQYFGPKSPPLVEHLF